MQKASLARALRQRQYALGQVATETLDALSDDAIIDSYITCSCCGEKQVTPQQLSMAIWHARDADDFLDRCDHDARRHP